jgi:2-dehydropantoate 2-reductase
MFARSPSIAIIGSGAVGGYYGARLAQHGADVHFLVRSDYDAVREHGWVIKSCDGDFTLPPQRMHVYQNAANMPAVELVIVTLKATANDQFPHLIPPLLKDDTAILTLQNGLGNEEELAGLFGDRRVLGGLAFTCINRIGPGLIHHMDHGLIRLGEFTSPTRSERARFIAELFNASQIHCQVLDDLKHGRWEKLVWNVPFNGLGAALDLTTDRLLATSAGVELVRELMHEVIATAAAIGVQLPPAIAQQKIDSTYSMGAYQTSMQIDRRHGRAMETETIIGKPLAVAEQSHVVTPVLAMLHRSLLTVNTAW